MLWQWPRQSRASSVVIVQNEINVTGGGGGVGGKLSCICICGQLVIQLGCSDWLQMTRIGKYSNDILLSRTRGGEDKEGISFQFKDIRDSRLIFFCLLLSDSFRSGEGEKFMTLQDDKPPQQSTIIILSINCNPIKFIYAIPTTLLISSKVGEGWGGAMKVKAPKEPVCVSIITVW